MTTRKVYIAELEDLNSRVAAMGMQLESMINQTIQVLKTMDAKAAEAIVRQDDIIDNMERDIEQSCIYILAKQAPVAADLRRVTSIMRLISDIERIADHCGDISEYLTEITCQKGLKIPDEIVDMLEMVKKMVAKTITCFIDEDVSHINSLIASDDEIDTYFLQIKVGLSACMRLHPENVESYVDFLLIAKYIERMADHSTNIAEWIAFLVTGDLEQYMNS